MSDRAGHKNMDGMSVVLMGNPIRGFSVYGPFTTLEEAREYAAAEEYQAWAMLIEMPPDLVEEEL